MCVCVRAGASAGNSSRQPQTQPICTDTNPVTTQSMEDDEDEGGEESERGKVGGREGEDKEVRFCSRNNLQAARDERSEVPTVAYVISLAALI